MLEKVLDCMGKRQERALGKTDSGSWMNLLFALARNVCKNSGSLHALITIGLLSTVLLSILSCGANDAVSLTDRARELQDKKQYAEAESLLRQAIAANPKYTEARLVLGRNFELQDELEDAQGEYQAVLEKQPNHITAHLYLGNIRRKVGDIPEALRLVERATELSPGDARLRQILGNLYEQTGNIEKARATLEKAVKLDPSDHLLHTDLARLHEKNGDIGQAIKEYREVLKLIDGLKTRKDEYEAIQAKLKEFGAGGG